MTDIQDDYIRNQERIVRETYDPSIRFLYNPRIERWIICEDRRITIKCSDPWIERDPDLEGVPGVGERTVFTALKKCELSDGNTFPPLAPLVIQILKLECPRNGDQNAADFFKKSMDKREKRSRDFIAEQGQRVYEDMLPIALHRKRFLPFEAKGSKSSTLFKAKRKRD